MTVELRVREAPDLNERLLSPLEETKEAKRLLGVVRNILTLERKIPRDWRVHFEELPDHKSARVYEESRRGEKSVIIESGGDRGEVKFIEADKYTGPRVYAHTQTAIVKINEFLESLRQTLLNRPKRLRRILSRKLSHQEGSLTPRVL